MSNRTISLTRDQLEEALDIAEIDWDYEGTIRSDYSGRGMYGDDCVGVVLGREKDAYALFAALAEVLDVDDAVRLARQSCSDSMGRDMIVYWPRLKFTE